jgi:hypothetical protein
LPPELSLPELLPLNCPKYSCRVDYESIKN